MVTFTDDFNRADGALGAPWLGGSSHSVISGAMGITASGDTYMSGVQLSSTDHEIYAEHAAGAGNYFRSLQVRANRVGTDWGAASFTGYQVTIRASGSTASSFPKIRKWIAGTVTDLSAPAWDETLQGSANSFRFEADGSTLTADRGATAAIDTVTDTSITTGTIASVGNFDSLSNAFTYVEGGDLAPPPVIFTDDFNRADGPLGSPWVDGRGSGVGIVSNELAVSALATAYIDEDFSADCYVEARRTNNGTLWLGLRADTGLLNGYLLEFTTDSRLTIWKIVSGAITELAFIDAPFLALDKAVRFAVSGSTLVVFLDGQEQLYATDTTFQTAGETHVGGLNITADDVRAGDNLDVYPIYPLRFTGPAEDDSVYSAGNDGQPITLGFRLATWQTLSATHLRFYKRWTGTGDIDLRIYDESDQSLVVQRTVTPPSGTGFQSVELNPSVELAQGNYRVCYYSPTGDYSLDTNRPLRSLLVANNLGGCYVYGDGYPSQTGDVMFSWYGADLTLTESPPPPAPLSIPWVHCFWADDPGFAEPADGASLPTEPHNLGTDGVAWNIADDPTWVSDMVNGKPAVRCIDWSGLNRIVPSGAYPVRTAVIVGRFRGTTDADIFDTSSGRSLLDARNGDIRMFAGSIVQWPGLADTDPHLFIAKWDATGDETLSIDDGVNITSSGNGGGLAGGGAIMVGYTSMNSGNVDGTEVAFAGLIDRELTAQEVSDLVAWYNAEYVPGGGGGVQNVYVGGQQVQAMYVGTDQVVRAYLGDTLVFGSAP